MPKTVTHYTHEFDQKGNHRIVSFKDGVPTPSSWFAFNTIASHKGILAATDYFNGALPCGLFKVSLVHYERLSN